MSSPIPLSPSFASLTTASPSSSASDSDDAPATPKVRFDQECVLIPDPLPASRLPRLVTKSYSLPLWRRKHREPSVLSDSEDDPFEDHVVFKVSVPSLSIKPRSPSRGDAAHRPLVSCLVHHDHPSADSPRPSCSSSPSPRVGRPRRASLPQPVQPEVVTVPLRACCAQCYPSIDSCLKAGDHYQVHFSKGAARRRKSVSDAHAPPPSRSIRHCLRDTMPGFDAIVAVDEIDRRRRSTDIDALTAFTVQMAPPADPDDLTLRRALSLPNEMHPCRPPLVASVLPPPSLCSRYHSHPHAAPIPEEDEPRLSPRRTPVPSPFASSTNLPSTRLAHAAPVTLLQRLTSPADPSLSDFASATPEKAALETPLPASPITPLSYERESSYFALKYEPPTTHERVPSTDSPTSSPSASPRLEHSRPGGLGRRKRSLINLPGAGSIFRASTQVLKGISSMGGVPMSA
ncbi:hypothetical protein C8Q79DRAFT_897042 [Trametes meyenii]|nr:hypothetical protein C8Q79DRAFT_897042 [Trametes meyenii]